MPKQTNKPTKQAAPKKTGPKPKLTHGEPLLEQLRALGRIQTTVKEAASVLRVSERTLQNFFAEYPDAKEAHDAGKLEACASLRRQQFKLAENGNATMAIWLGKQYLGQRDVSYSENVNANYTISDQPMSKDEWRKTYGVEAPKRPPTVVN